MDNDDTDDLIDTGSNLIKLALPANLLVQIDAQVGSAFVDRQDFIRAAIRHYLEYMQTASNAHDEDLG